MSFKVLFLSLLFLSHSNNVFGLAIDEKLPLRILKVSTTRKTVLINRGIEDGLVLGDHAKFFLTTGVVARGVVVKTSPSRSVWSLYRVINADEINSNKVMNLKIATPVKISDDPSKMISAEDIPEEQRERIRYHNGNTIPYYQGRPAPHYQGEPVMTVPEGVPLAEGARDLDDLDRIEIEASGGQNISYAGGPVTRSWEVFSNLYLSSLSTTVESDTTTSEASSSLSGLDFSLGIEKYFYNSQSFWQNVSIGAQIHKASYTIGNVSGVEVSSDLLEYGVLANYHFQEPRLVHRLIWNMGFGFGFGSVTDSYSAGTTTSAVDLNGSSNYFNFGAGIKYNSGPRLGGRVNLDYYRRGETYDSSSSSITKVVSGFRVLLGLSYKF